MSSTRRADPGTAPRQERFSSSAEFERGLMGNLVARRLEVVDDEKQRGLVWFIQWLSHNMGLEKLAADLQSKYPKRIATRAMQQFGCAPGQIYDAEQVRAVRKEFPMNAGMCARFPLKGESERVVLGVFDDIDEFRQRREQSRLDADGLPARYPAKVFADKCHDAAHGLEQYLSDLCLDPAQKLDRGPWWFPTLIDTLLEYQADWIAARSAGQPVTELGRTVFDTLDFCLQSGNLVLLEGQPTTGKTFASKQFCDSHPGQVRYVDTPSGQDDKGFFTAIAKALGVAVRQTSKAQELRDRIETVLQSGKLAIVFDRAHYLWPQSNYRDTTAGRVDWVLSALVEKGVPVALISSPIFMRMLVEVERKCCWESAPLKGHLTTQPLPSKLSESDLAAIAKYWLPDGCAQSIELLVLHAKTSPKYLGAIKSAADRAAHFAAKAKRQKVTIEDVAAALQLIEIPSDNSIKIATTTPRKTARARTVAAPLPRASVPAAAPAQPVRATIPAPASLDRARNNLAAENEPQTSRLLLKLDAA